MCNELVQSNLNLGLLDQSRSKTKNLVVELPTMSLKKLGIYHKNSSKSKAF